MTPSQRRAAAGAETCLLQQLLADAEPSVRAEARKVAQQLHPDAATRAAALCIAAKIDDDDEVALKLE